MFDFGVKFPVFDLGFHACLLCALVWCNLGCLDFCFELLMF